MSYAIRDDKQGWRRVDSPDDVMTGEYFSDEAIDIVKLPPTDSELKASALSERDALLAVAAIRIAPLQDAVDLEVATAAEVKTLKKWKQYRVDLNRISEMPGFPADFDWPKLP